MWVRLKSLQRIDKQGKPRDYHPGDWVDVGKQTAQLWISWGDAEIPSFTRGTGAQLSGSGVLVRGGELTQYQAMFDGLKIGLSVMVDEIPHVAFERTLIWNPKVALRLELIVPGFNFLETWEIAAPLYSYDELAAKIGGDEARARTKAVIRDLRVPVYDTRLMFVRRCENTDRLFEAWAKEREGGDDERLSFMRAFYQVKPLMLALPVTWHSPHYGADV
jgi:hypothetical protein